MLNIPNLPTDNLYKFLALFGLIITLTCIIIPNYLIVYSKNELNKIRIEIAQYNIEREIFNEQTADIEHDITILENELKELEHSLDDGIITKESTYIEKLEPYLNPKFREFKEFYYKYEDRFNPTRKMHNEILQKKSRLDELFFKNKRQAALIKGRLLILSNESDFIESNKTFFIFGTIIGFITTISGFLLWYFKVQVFLDLKLKDECSNLIETK